MDALNRIAQEVLKGLPVSKMKREPEPWRRWLEILRAQNWRGLSVAGRCPVSELVWQSGVKIGRPPAIVRRELRLSTGDEVEADYWIEDLLLENVFRESADFCEDMARAAELIEPEIAVQTEAVEPNGDESQQPRAVTPVNAIPGRNADWHRAVVGRPRRVRRNARYEAIDQVLRDIAKSQPKGHEEVFQALDGRCRVPNADPFRGAGGWHAGFRKNRVAAQAWLSKAWSRLNLPAFSRGPKK